MTCPICICDIDETSSIYKLRCGHTFHTECLRKWFFRNKTCPLCRYDATHVTLDRDFNMIDLYHYLAKNHKVKSIKEHMKYIYITYGINDRTEWFCREELKTEWWNIDYFLDQIDSNPDTLMNWIESQWLRYKDN